MTDIVERLRDSATGKPDEWRSGPCMLLREAADEIERLTEALRPFAKMYAAPGGDLDKAIQEARRALEGK